MEFFEDLIDAIRETNGWALLVALGIGGCIIWAGYSAGPHTNAVADGFVIAALCMFAGSNDGGRGAQQVQVPCMIVFLAGCYQFIYLFFFRWA